MRLCRGVLPELFGLREALPLRARRSPGPQWGGVNPMEIDDVIAQLVSAIDHRRAELSRLERALTALRGGASAVAGGGARRGG